MERDLRGPEGLEVVVCAEEVIGCLLSEMERWHIVGRATCPHLPGVAAVRTARDMVKFRGRHDGEFYVAALNYAQSLWLEGKPAQSLLQMNKAMMADLGGRADEPEDLEDGRKRLGWPLPYAAKVWVMRNAGGNEFPGPLALLRRLPNVTNDLMLAQWRLVSMALHRSGALDAWRGIPTRQPATCQAPLLQFVAEYANSQPAVPLLSVLESNFPGNSL